MVAAVLIKPGIITGALEGFGDLDVDSVDINITAPEEEDEPLFGK
jgi:hypothetical protein